jgi:hypothetical protein
MWEGALDNCPFAPDKFYADIFNRWWYVSRLWCVRELGEYLRVVAMWSEAEINSALC